MQSPEAADSESEKIDQTPPRGKQQGHYSRFLWLLTIFIPTLCSIMLCATQIGFRLSVVDSVDRAINPLGTADYGRWPRIAFAPVAEKLSTLIVEERAQTATITNSSVESQTTTPISTATPLVQTASPTVSPTPDISSPGETATASEPTPTVLTMTSVVVVSTATTLPASATSTITETSTAIPLISPTSTAQAIQPPIAVFAANPLSGPAALNVVFTNFSSGFITSYLWNFGNGQTSSAISPTHIYSTPGTYFVTLTVTGPGGTSSSTQTINVTNVVDNRVDLRITKSVSASTVVQNQTFAYILNVFNNGPAIATGVQIVDTLPAQVTLVNAPDCTPNGNTVTCFIGTLNPATNAQRVLTVRANAIANNVLNTATAFSSQADSNISNNSASASVNIQALPQADIAISKSSDILNPNPGDTITFTVTATNNGPNTATNLRISDVLSSGLTFSSFNATQGNYNSSNGRWNIGTLNNGSSATLQLTVIINSGTGGQIITNTASVLALDQSDPNASNNSSSASISVQVPLFQSDLSISKTVNISNPNPGDSVTFTITVTNNGPDNATGIFITDVLPTGLTFSAATPDQGSYNNDTWTVGTLNNGSSTTLQLTVTINNNAGGQTITNTAAISASDVTDPNDSNNIASINITVASMEADLEFTTFTFNNLNPAVGETVIATIVITNNGPATATNIVLSDSFGSATLGSVQLVSVTHGNSTGSDWSIPSLNSGETATMTITLIVDASASGTTITRWREIIASDQPDPDSIPNNGASGEDDYNAYTVTVQPIVDLALNVASVSNYSPTEGETITIMWEIINNSSSSASNVVVSIGTGDSGLLSTGYVPAPSQGSMSGDQWIVGTLAPFATATLEITSIIDVGTAGMTITRTRNIESADQVDLNASNNSDSFTLNVQASPVADVGIMKMVDNPTPYVGSTITYTITATNNGPSNASDVRVSDTLPAAVTYVSHTSTQGTYTPDTGDWEIGTLNNAASVTLTIQATINAGTEDQIITNTALLVNSTPTDTITGNNSASVNMTVSTASPPCPIMGEPNIGPANGIFCSMPAGNLVLDLSSNPIITGPGYDLVYYERPLYSNPTIIHLDHMIIEVATSSSGPWMEVFNWGNGIIDTNTNIGVAGYGSTGESNNQSVPMTNPPLYGVSPYITGIAIDVDARVGAGTYSWVRLRTSSAATAFDALQPVSIPIAGADLAISKSVNNANPTPGSSINFTVTITNNGPGNASGINVSDVLPAGLNFSSANPSQGNFNNSTGIWDIGSLNNAASASLQITATVSGAVNQNITNTTSIVASNAPDSNNNNNTASVSLSVVEEASDTNLFNLNLSSATINVNDTVDINMQVRTLGPQNATNVQIVFPIPNNLEIVSHSCPQLVLNAGTYTCTFGNFNVGNVTDVVFRIQGIAEGQASITFTASSSEADPVANNNSVTINITVAG